MNLTARLCSLCTGTDLVLSSTVRADPEVVAHLTAAEANLTRWEEFTMLRGFGAASFAICRVRQGCLGART